MTLALLPPDVGLSLVQRAGLTIIGVAGILFVALLIAEFRSKRHAQRERTARLLRDAMHEQADSVGRHRAPDVPDEWPAEHEPDDADGQ